MTTIDTRHGPDGSCPAGLADWREMLRIGHIMVVRAAWRTSDLVRDGAARWRRRCARCRRDRMQPQDDPALLEGGIIKELLVRNGDYVAENQLLMKPRSDSVRGAKRPLRNQLAILLAQEARLMAEYELRLDPRAAPGVTDRASNRPSRRWWRIRPGLSRPGANELMRNVQLAQSESTRRRRDIDQNTSTPGPRPRRSRSIKKELDFAAAAFREATRHDVADQAAGARKVAAGGALSTEPRSSSAS